MPYEQSVDLILSALYESRPGLLSSATLQELEDAGTIAPIVVCGLGSPVFVGRNSSLDLSLSILDIPQAGAFDVSVETAASPSATAWRKLGAFATASAVGSSALSLSGSDAWVRGKYKPSAGAAFALSLSGRARLVLLASAAQSVSGVGAAVDVAQYRSVRMTLDASALSGSLSVTLETAGSATSPTWRTVSSSPAALTAAGSAGLAGWNLDRYVRVRWTLTGTATFGVAGVSRLVLAQPSDRARMGVGEGAFPGSSGEDDDDALLAATADVLGPFGARYVMPPRAWADDVREACIRIADWKRIASRGTEPGKKLDASESVYYERYTYYVGNPHSVTTAGASGWVQRVAEKKANPHEFIDSATPDPIDGEVERVAVFSEPLRGWGRGRMASVL